jgi:trehalose synthase
MRMTTSPAITPDRRLVPPAAGAWPAITDVPIAPLPTERFRAVLDDREYRDLLELRRRAQVLLRGRAVWCVNSTARGGGVAEMLSSLLAFTRGAGIDTRWAVVGGDAEFFRVTKRLHNRLHGSPGDGGPLGPVERAAYDRTQKAAAADLAMRVREGDVVLLHDPQTAGLVAPMQALGARVVWRAHVGVDAPNDFTREAWDFLRPMLTGADGFVFSRQRHVWSGLDERRVTIIPPSIDVFAPKNQLLSEDAVRAILIAAGLQRDGVCGAPVFLREDGTPSRVERVADTVQERPLSGSEQIVVQVSRWDRLKDPLGVMQGFAGRACTCRDAHLVLAGPAVGAVTDDPEGAEVLAEVIAAWHALPFAVRARVHIVSLPMEDPEENAAIVNALQTRADVIVQKSLAEGFGLTVAEAMWKTRPVLASAVGGIRDQITDGVTGVLLEDPTDLAGFGNALCMLLGDPALARRIGVAGRERVRERFLEPRHLHQWVSVLRDLLA